MDSPGNQKNNITNIQPTGTQASTPKLINLLTSRYVQIAEIIGIARITKTNAKIPTIKKVGDFIEKRGIKEAKEKARTTIKPTITICVISDPRKNNTFPIL